MSCTNLSTLMSCSNGKLRITSPDGQHNVNLRVPVGMAAPDIHARSGAAGPCVEARAGAPGDVIASSADWSCVDAGADGSSDDIVASREDEDAASVAGMACANWANRSSGLKR